MDLDTIMRSKYTSLAFALLNGYFAIGSAAHGNWLFFILCGVCAAYCFRNFIRAS